MTGARTAAVSALQASQEALDDRLEQLGAAHETDVGPLLAVMADAHSAGDASMVLLIALRLTGAKPSELARVAIDRNGPAFWMTSGPAMVAMEADGKIVLAPVAPAPSTGPGRRPNLPVWPAEATYRAPGHGLDAVEYAVSFDMDVPEGVRIRLAAIAEELRDAHRRGAEAITVEAAEEADVDVRRLERERAVLSRRLEVLVQEAKKETQRESAQAAKAEEVRRAAELAPLQAELAAAAAKVHEATLPKERRRWGRR